MTEHRAQSTEGRREIIRVLLSVFCVLVFGCIHQVKRSHLSDVSPEEARGLKQAVIIDVREPEEYADAHIEGSILAPLSEIDRWSKTLPEKKIIVVCRSGRRSREAAERLVGQGRVSVYNLEGGIVAWHKAGYKLVGPKKRAPDFKPKEKIKWEYGKGCEG